MLFHAHRAAAPQPSSEVPVCSAARRDSTQAQLRGDAGATRYTLIANTLDLEAQAVAKAVADREHTHEAGIEDGLAAAVDAKAA